MTEQNQDRDRMAILGKPKNNLRTKHWTEGLDSSAPTCVEITTRPSANAIVHSFRKHNMAADRSKWPPMVRIGLWGVSNRTAAWAFATGSFILAVVCVVLGFKEPRFFGGVALLFAALWYYLCIRWVDKHNQWA